MTIDQVIYWHWWILGAALILIEMLAPGFFFLWLGAAAFVVGLVLLAAPGLAWEYQLLLFAALSVASILAWRVWFRRSPPVTDQPALNRRGSQYVGRLFTLDAPIVNGVGKLRVDDTTWKVAGPDCEAGARVRVTGLDGVVLRVEAAGGDAPPG